MNHKNGRKHDNRLANLEYVSPSENMQHAYRNGMLGSLWGRDRPRPERDNRGVNRGAAKLTNEQVLEIRRCYAAREMNRVELGRRFGVSKGCISEIINRRTWRHI